MSEETFKENIEQHAEGSVKEKSLWNKITKYIKHLGIKTVYTILLMYNAYRRKDTPKWAKRIITGTLAYFIAPLDAIPDLTPFLGFTDDLGILGFGLVTVAAYINEDVRNKSRRQLSKWFGNYDEEELKTVDDKL
jgi:uncharacterized membrane protein YkvA (DUF1232 family)